MFLDSTIFMFRNVRDISQRFTHVMYVIYLEICVYYIRNIVVCRLRGKNFSRYKMRTLRRSRFTPV